MNHATVNRRVPRAINRRNINPGVPAGYYLGDPVMSTKPQWALCYHCHSLSPRARRWYYVARLIEADGQWFELYWHPDNVRLATKSQPETRRRARELGVDLMRGLYRDAPPPRKGSVMERVL